MAVRDSRQSMPKQPSSFAHTERERERKRTDNNNSNRAVCTLWDLQGYPRQYPVSFLLILSQSDLLDFVYVCLCVCGCETF
jgi:hypothetical protein